MASPVNCHIRYDPEVDVAILSFTEPSPSDGTVLELDDQSGLAGLVHLRADGEFSQLELLGAGRAIPQFVPALHAPPAGMRDYHRGTVRVSMENTERRGSVRFGLDESAVTGGEYEISATAKEPSSVVATLTFADSGVLRALTLFHGTA